MCEFCESGYGRYPVRPSGAVPGVHPSAELAAFGQGLEHPGELIAVRDTHPDDQSVVRDRMRSRHARWETTANFTQKEPTPRTPGTSPEPGTRPGFLIRRPPEQQS